MIKIALILLMVLSGCQLSYKGCREACSLQRDKCSYNAAAAPTAEGISLRENICSNNEFDCVGECVDKFNATSDDIMNNVKPR